MALTEPTAVAKRFRDAVGRAEDEIDLAEAVLLIAAHADEHLDVPKYLSELDTLAASLAEQLPESSDDADRLRALNRFMFEQQGFGPSLQDYYDPRNSCLDQVLDRRVGIPITLSIVYMEIGRRIGLAIDGVPFPGHFLVRCRMGEETIVLDPFAHGASLSFADLQQRLRAIQGDDITPTDLAYALRAATTKDILTRMLGNLKAIYVQRQDDYRMLTILEMIVALAPDAAAEVRDRGIVYLRLECFRAALADFERYLELAPTADDAGLIRKGVVELRKTASRLN